MTDLDKTLHVVELVLYPQYGGVSFENKHLVGGSDGGKTIIISIFTNFHRLAPSWWWIGNRCTPAYFEACCETQRTIWQVLLNVGSIELFTNCAVDMMGTWWSTLREKRRFFLLRYNRVSLNLTISARILTHSDYNLRLGELILKIDSFAYFHNLLNLA